MLDLDLEKKINRNLYNQSPISWVMQRKVWALGIVLILCLSIGGSTQTAVETNNVEQELEWWDVYSRDKNRDGISDVLIWKLEQGEQFFNLGEARVFVRYDHHPTDYDVQKL